MQPDRMTVKTQEALAAAQRLARPRRNAQVGPNHLLVVRTSRTAASSSPCSGARARTPTPSAARRTRSLTRRPRSPATPRPQPTPDAALGDLFAKADETAARHGRRVRVHRAPPAGAGGRSQDRRGRVGRAAGRGRPGCARPAPRDRPEPRGPLPGAGAVRPRPDRGRRAGQARPRHRPRRRDPARDPDPLAPHQEQPGAHRRARRRQDRHRRGARAADRGRRRARDAARPARDRAGHGRAGRRRQVPRRVRGAAQGACSRRSPRPRAR